MDFIEYLGFQTSESKSKALACKSKSKFESAKTGLESGLEAKFGLQYYKSVNENIFHQNTR